MLLVLEINVPPESEECVVEGLVVVYGVIHPCQILYMPHITLTSLRDSVPTQVSLFLDHYATTEMHC